MGVDQSSPGGLYLRPRGRRPDTRARQTMEAAGGEGREGGSLQEQPTMWPTTNTTVSPLETTDPIDDDSLRLTTISTNKHEVANGFVKNGSSLPYVYETNDSGNRKRSSKMIPICGICGKKFVCVTTMKRHLVTHTGEKPFSCKVCGKQYTQKGNLRVHERTHRNDRPFECHVCHQKFYRKEPMQKHQWRQHGIIHHKTRPVDGAGPQLSSTPTPDHQLQQASQQQQPQIVLQPQML